MYIVYPLIKKTRFLPFKKTAMLLPCLKWYDGDDGDNDDKDDGVCCYD